MAVDHRKQYSQHMEFEIHTDHKSLIHLGEQKLTQRMQHEAFMILLGLQYKLVYKKGLANRAAGALSIKENFEEVMALSKSKTR